MAEISYDAMLGSKKLDEFFDIEKTDEAKKE